MFYYVYYASELPKIENAYRKNVVLFLLADTHSAKERQMVKMCMCVCACICRMTVLAWLALFLSWGSLGLETATVVVSIQAMSSQTEKQQLSASGHPAQNTAICV